MVNTIMNSTAMNSKMTSQTTETKDDKSPLAKRFRGFMPVVVDVETAGFNAQTDAHCDE